MVSPLGTRRQFLSGSAQRRRPFGVGPAKAGAAPIKYFAVEFFAVVQYRSEQVPQKRELLRSSTPPSNIFIRHRSHRSVHSLDSLTTVHFEAAWEPFPTMLNSLKSTGAVADDPMYSASSAATGGFDQTAALSPADSAVIMSLATMMTLGEQALMVHSIPLTFACDVSVPCRDI